MSEEEPFLSRWSRLKRKQGTSEPQEPRDSRPVDEPAERRTPARSDQTAAKDEDEAFLASLPKLEDLTPDSDFRKFMDPRVPSALRHAALRRAWTLDPAIRDFMEIAENQYDWNAPGGVPGFGPINVVGGAIQSVLASVPEASEPAGGGEAVGESESPPPDPRSAAPRADEEASARADVSSPAAAGEVPPSSAGESQDQKDHGAGPGGQGRRHGKALPV